jgi:hypothetical protein
MISMTGKITSPGKYSDGTPRFEVGVYLEDDSSLPYTHHQRLSFSLRIGQQIFICGLNSTEASGCWIAPDIYDFHNPNKKLRLAEVLLEEGYNKNEKVQVDYLPDSKEIRISKISDV